jgi:hypothetical protein
MQSVACELPDCSVDLLSGHLLHCLAFIVCVYEPKAQGEHGTNPFRE